MTKEIIAKCYLYKDGDEKNLCLLSEETLTVILNSKKEIFFNHWIKSISFKKKKYLIPIVFGGIAASLAGLGLFQYYLNPWVMLSLMFGAALIMYYGIVGGLALTIETPIKEYDFFIGKATPNMQSFIAFANTIIHGDSILFYSLIQSNTWNEAKKLDTLKVPKSGLKLKTTKPAKKEGYEVISIQSKELPVEIKYSTEGEELTPTIYQDIPISLISEHPELD